MGNGRVFGFLAIAILLAVVARVGNAYQTKTGVAEPQNKVALQENEVKQLLLLMDTDKNGKISKQEWMNFMSTEFDRLDTDKSGELDPKELTLSRIRPSTFPAAGK